MNTGTVTGIILAIILGLGIAGEIGGFTGLAVAYIVFTTHMTFWKCE